MINVGGMFGGGVVEQVIVKAIFDNDGYKTGVKETIKVNQKLSSEIQKQSTHIKNADGEWEELSHTLKRNTQNADTLRKKLEQINKHMAKMRAAKFAKMHQRIYDMGRSDIVRDSKGQMTEGTRITEMTPGLNQFTKRIVSSETQIKKLKNGMEEHLTTFKNYRGGIVKTTKAIKRQQSQFQMWALSFLFAGMQIKRTAEMITRASVGTFMKITQGQTEAGRSLIGLAANFKFLQFSIGQAIGTALKPLMPILTNMIRGVSQFVQLHPEATFAAIAGAFILGTGLFLGGQMVMFSNAAIDLVNQSGGLKKIGERFGTIKDNFIPIAEKALGGILISIGIKDIFEGIKKEDFQQTVQGGLETLAGGLFLVGKSKGGVLTLIALFAFKFVADDDFAESVIKFFTRIAQLVIGIIAGLAFAMWEHISAPFKRLSKMVSAMKEGDISELKSIAFGSMEHSLGGSLISGFKKGLDFAYSDSTNQAVLKTQDDFFNLYKDMKDGYKDAIGIKDETSSLDNSNPWLINRPAPISNQQSQSTVINGDVVINGNNMGPAKSNDNFLGYLANNEISRMT